MKKEGSIVRINPRFAIAGGEVEIEVKGFHAEPGGRFGCYFGETRGRIVAASARRILASVPEMEESGPVSVHLECGGKNDGKAEITVGRKLAEDLHIVANPVVDPIDGSIIVTRSGSRGQEIDQTLFRITPDGFMEAMPALVMNPTGMAFDDEGELFVTNRADGQIWRIDREGDAHLYADGLGIATGIAFDKDGVMYVGDRAGVIYRVLSPSRIAEFASLEASVAAYHMAFGPDGRLYVTSPGLASHDAVYAIDAKGKVSKYFRGFGRPQGLAFDREGNLYVAACYQGRHGIVKIDQNGTAAERFVSGNGIVGLCFTRQGRMIIAANYEVFEISTDIKGLLAV